jgi:hypothetical protein
MRLTGAIIGAFDNGRESKCAFDVGIVDYMNDDVLPWTSK